MVGNMISWARVLDLTKKRTRVEHHCSQSVLQDVHTM